MHLIDWLVVGAYLVWIVWDGLRRTEGSDQLEGYFSPTAAFRGGPSDSP